MNLLVAIGMKQYQIARCIRAAQAAVDKMMYLPTAFLRDLFITNRAVAILRKPQMQQAPVARQLIDHFE